MQNCADALSWRPDFNDRKEDNISITALSDKLFIKHINTITLYKNAAEVQKGKMGD